MPQPEDKFPTFHNPPPLGDLEELKVKMRKAVEEINFNPPRNTRRRKIVLQPDKEPKWESEEMKPFIVEKKAPPPDPDWEMEWWYWKPGKGFVRQEDDEDNTC